MMGKQELPMTGWTYTGVDQEGNKIGMWQATPKSQIAKAMKTAKMAKEKKK